MQHAPAPTSTTTNQQQMEPQHPSPNAQQLKDKQPSNTNADHRLHQHHTTTRNRQAQQPNNNQATATIGWSSSTAPRPRPTTSNAHVLVDGFHRRCTHFHGSHHTEGGVCTLQRHCLFIDGHSRAGNLLALALVGFLPLQALQRRRLVLLLHVCASLLRLLVHFLGDELLAFLQHVERLVQLRDAPLGRWAGDGWCFMTAVGVLLAVFASLMKGLPMW